LEVQSVRFFFFFDFILHNAYTVDACAPACTLPSLSLIDMTYGGHKSGAGFCSGRRRRFLVRYGFRFSTTL